MTDVTAEGRIKEAGETLSVGRLGVGSLGKGSGGFAGMITLIATEASLFVYLLFSFYYMALLQGDGFFPPEPPSLGLSGANTAILILSSVAGWYGDRSIGKGRRWRCVLGLLAGFVLGVAFVGIQIKEWNDQSFSLSSDPHGSLYFTVTGFHMAHVVAGLLMLAVLILWTALGLFDRHRHAPVTLGVWYWHFVDVVWLAVFVSFYVFPYFAR
jgi:cytochrome c oxidase subunit III